MSYEEEDTCLLLRKYQSAITSASRLFAPPNRGSLGTGRGVVQGTEQRFSGARTKKVISTSMAPTIFEM